MATPLLICPECSSHLQSFAISLKENMFLCIGERKRERYRGLVEEGTLSELKECSYPFSETTRQPSFFVCSATDTHKKAQEISRFLKTRRDTKYQYTLSTPDPKSREAATLPWLDKSESFALDHAFYVKGSHPPCASQVSTDEFCTQI